jgi:RNA polymerase subunit RPABC4/transcription elongation factor Spt4
MKSQNGDTSHMMSALNENHDEPSEVVNRISFSKGVDHGQARWITRSTKVGKDTWSQGTKTQPTKTRTCERCHSVCDLYSADCPICGHVGSDLQIATPEYQGIIECWVKRECLICHEVCYERSCPVCGERTRMLRKDANATSPSQEREPMTWKITSLRVRTPTGLSGLFPHPVRIESWLTGWPID